MVMLAPEVAKLYGVETPEISQAIKNNLDKFPKGFYFELSKKKRKRLSKFLITLR